jgi:glycosyltransferase involved in cell wall biosynthesis
MKVAIISDWIIGGGAEQVVLQLHQMYPEAPIYTSYISPQWRERLAGADIRTGYLQRWPFSKLRKFLPPLRMRWFSHLKLKDFDLVISSSGAEAKAVKVREDAVHITYCHAPTHYYWARYDEYMGNPGFGLLNPLARFGLKLLAGPMRRADLKASKRPDYFIANSTFTKDQISKYYGRDSVVIHPPVEVEDFAGHNHPASDRSGFVIVGRQAPYKKTALAVQAANLAKQPLIVIGDGPLHKTLRRLAGRKVTLIRHSTHDRLAEHVGRAKGFIFPSIEDFGIAPVEAMAAGTPVLAFDGGGAKDYVNRLTGRFFGQAKAPALADAMRDFAGLNFNHQAIAKYAQQFSAKNFRANVGNFVKKHVK